MGNLPEDVPARESFQLVFDWTSTGNPLISDQANITIEARPDHRWEIDIAQGASIPVTPGQEPESDYWPDKYWQH